MAGAKYGEKGEVARLNPSEPSYTGTLKSREKYRAIEPKFPMAGYMTFSFLRFSTSSFE